MFKREDCKALFFYAELMGREVAMGADEQEARAKIRGAIAMFMMIDNIYSSNTDYIFDLVFDRYTESLIAYSEDKGGRI